MRAVNRVQMKSSVSIKSVAIPAEHGGWGFLSEPLLLGLLIAPSFAGVGIALLMSAIFLLHQPFKIVVKDRRKGRVYERTRLAQRFLVFYGVIGAVGAAVAWFSATAPAWILPLACATPFAVLQLVYEFRNDGRSLISEIVGALVLASAAPAILLAADRVPLAAILAWAVIGLRIIPSILYVRARLRLSRGKPVSRALSVGLHAAAIGIGVLLWALGLVNAALAIASALLLARAIYGLYFSPPVMARVVGFQELFSGMAYAAACAFALSGM